MKFRPTQGGLAPEEVTWATGCLGLACDLVNTGIVTFMKYEISN